MKRLLDVLREDLHLTGTKEGCGEGECVSVLMNGDLVNSCLVPILQARGAVICTIEGMAQGDRQHPIQQCFLKLGGAQCGICTPGMILATEHLLRQHPQPTMEQIREGLAGNLCRSPGYMRIFEAVQTGFAATGGRAGDERVVRSDAADFDLVAPASLDAVLTLLAEFPGEFLPIAGGTESMVAFGAGRLQARKHVSLWGLRELRFIATTAETLTIGAGSTFTDIRKHPIIASDFPMLAQAASWTGSIANQNRGTLGGNIVNGSPPPTLHRRCWPTTPNS